MDDYGCDIPDKWNSDAQTRYSKLDINSRLIPLDICGRYVE